MTVMAATIADVNWRNDGQHQRQQQPQQLLTLLKKNVDDDNGCNDGRR